jgi:molybdate transport system substrate-binding protein
MKLALVVLLLGITVSLPLHAGIRGEVTVSAAISLKNAFEEIGKVLEARQGIHCVFNYGASGDLAKQISAGAPVDVFAAAAMKEMDALEKQGMLEAGTRSVFAGNSIVLIAPAGSTGISSFDALAKGFEGRLAIGNPKTVPAGRYAEEVLKHFALLPLLQEKLVYAENVRQVLDYVARGEAGVGIVYATDAIARGREVAVLATAPPDAHGPVRYPVAVMKDSRNAAAAKAFIALLLSKQGQDILRKHGFTSAK